MCEYRFVARLTAGPVPIGPVPGVREAGLADVRILVGGAPVTAEWAAEISADAFAPDAATAVEVAKRVLAAG